MWVDVCPVLETWEVDSAGLVLLGLYVLTIVRSLVRPLVRLWVVVCADGVVLWPMLAVPDVPVISKGWVILLDLVWLVAVVWTELGEFVLSLAVNEDWLLPVVCCEVVARTVLPELVAMLPVPVVCLVEEAVPLVVGFTRLALELCTEAVDRRLLLPLTGGRLVPLVCPAAVERTLPPVLVACSVPLVCAEAIKELMWLTLGVTPAPAEVTEDWGAVICCEAADVLIWPLVVCSEGAEVVASSITGGA